MSIQNKTAVAKQKKAAEPKVTYIQKVIKEDTYLVLADSAMSLEDEFGGLYYTSSAPTNVFIEPPYSAKQLSYMPMQNNILNQCIEAMEVNIDSTGHEFVAIDTAQEPDQNEVNLLTDFFNEPYPGTSFVTMRRLLRREMEAVGYGFLEVLRTIDKSVAAVRNAETHAIRLVKLDDPVPVEKTVMRAGKEQVFTIQERERRFVRRVGNTAMNIFYREFGTTRELNKNTGEWESPTNPVKPEDRATELLYFGVNPDVQTQYYVPRWINQLPSVLGSRKAEEQNLEYFDAGGMPPALIFIQGGTLATTAAEELRMYLSGQNKNKKRAVVVEAQSSSGSLDAAGTVQVKVERFGAESTDDAMYQKYDQNAEDHVRTGFRLPPLFVGKAADYNYATAVVAYMVAEAQVFAPERGEFDSILNHTLIKALGVKKTKIRSLPITLKQVSDQLTALGLIKDKVKGEDFVQTVSSISGLSLTYDEATDTAAKALLVKQQAQQPGQPAAQQGTSTKGPIQQTGVTKSPSGAKKASPVEVLELATSFAQMRGAIACKEDLSEFEQVRVLKMVEQLDEEDTEVFMTMVASFMFGSNKPDLVKLTECAHGHA